MCPAPLPYRGKLPVHKGASLCSLPAAVHCGGGPTPWCSSTLTGLHKRASGSCPPLADFIGWGTLALQGFVSCSTSPLPPIITVVSAQYMHNLWSQYKMLIPKTKNKKQKTKHTQPGQCQTTTGQECWEGGGYMGVLMLSESGNSSVGTPSRSGGGGPLVACHGCCTWANGDMLKS
jgi:hypothetical protein